MAAVKGIPRGVEAVRVKLATDRTVFRFVASLAELAVPWRASLAVEIDAASVDYFEEGNGAGEAVVVLIEVPADAVSGDNAAVREVEQIASLADDTLAELVIDHAVGPEQRLVVAGVANQLETYIAHHAHSGGRIGQQASCALVDASTVKKRKALEAASTVVSPFLAVQHPFAAGVEERHAWCAEGAG